MDVLTVNVGSSSLKLRLLDADDEVEGLRRSAQTVREVARSLGL